MERLWCGGRGCRVIDVEVAVVVVADGVVAVVGVENAVVVAEGGC